MVRCTADAACATIASGRAPDGHERVLIASAAAACAGVGEGCRLPCRNSAASLVPPSPRVSRIVFAPARSERRRTWPSRGAGPDAGRDRPEKSARIAGRFHQPNEAPMSRGPELPSINQLAEIADDFGLDMSLDDLTNQREAMRGAIRSLRHIDDMPEERPAVVYPRTSGYRPHPDEKPLQRLVLAGRGQGRGLRPPGRRGDRRQGRGLARRRADDERLTRPRRLRADHRRHHRDPHARRRRHHRRQDGVCRLLLLGRRPHQRLRARAQSAQAHPCARRLVQGERCGGGRRRRGDGDRRRPGRLHPHPRLLVRRGRAQGDLRPHSLYRVPRDRDDPRSHRPDDEHRREHRSHALGAGRPRSARSAPARRDPGGLRAGLHAGDRRGLPRACASAC